MIARHVPIIFILLLPVIAWAEKPLAPKLVDGAVNVGAEQAVELILDNPQLVVIDARREEEYMKGHIEGAINILDEDITPQLLQAKIASKATPILFYCNGIYCLRSSNAATKSLKMGYQQVYWFRGGWLEWVDKRLPVVKGLAE